MAPDIIYFKDLKVSEVLNRMNHKVNNNEVFCLIDAINLLLLPDMDMDIDMSLESFFEVNCNLLKKANIPNEVFKQKLLLCELKMLQRFFDEKEYERFEKMLEVDATEYGIEPWVTGFEEACMIERNFGFRSATHDIARNCIEKGLDVEYIADITNLPVKKVLELKKELEDE